MFDFIVNVQVAVLRDGKYLFIVRGYDEEHLPGVKGLPGGKAENGDLDDQALEAAGTREVEEETGVVVAPELHYVRSNVFGDRVMNVVLLARWQSSEPSPQSPGEVAACMWLSPEDVAADKTIPEWEQEHIRQAEEVRRRVGW